MRQRFAVEGVTTTIMSLRTVRLIEAALCNWRGGHNHVSQDNPFFTCLSVTGCRFNDDDSNNGNDNNNDDDDDDDNGDDADDNNNNSNTNDDDDDDDDDDTNTSNNGNNRHHRYYHHHHRIKRRSSRFNLLTVRTVSNTWAEVTTA